MSEKQLLIKRIKLVVSSVLCLYSLIMASLAFARWKTKADDFHEIVSNWEQRPFVELTTVAAFSQCPSGFEEVNIDYADYPGSLEFCDCTSALFPFFGQHAPYLNKTDTGPKGICWVNETVAGCTEVSGSGGGEVFWFSRRLCGRRLVGEQNNAVNRPRAYGNETCVAGYHKCGYLNSTAADSLDHEREHEYTCTPDGQPCPIRQVFRAANGVSSNCLATDSFGTGYTLCTSRVDGANEYPVVKVESFPDYPCWPGKTGSSVRDWLDWRRGGWPSCSKSDPRWSTIVSRDERAFYVEVSQPPAHVFARCEPCRGSTSKNFVAAYRPEIDWARDCPMTRRQFVDMAPQVKSLTAAQIAVLVFAVFSLVFIGIAYNAWEFMQEDEPGWEDDSDDQKCLRFSRLAFSLTMAVAKIIPLSIALAISLSLRSKFRELAQAACTTEPDTLETISFFAGETESQADFNIGLIVGNILEILLDLYQIWKGCRAGQAGALPRVDAGEVMLV